jgi:hypothetical protein
MPEKVNFEKINCRRDSKNSRSLWEENLSDGKNEEDEDDLLQRTGNFTAISTSHLRRILKLKNYHQATPTTD